MSTKEKANAYVWSRIQSAVRELKDIKYDLAHASDNSVLSVDQLANRKLATERKLEMYNYLFKLIETDENH